MGYEAESDGEEVNVTQDALKIYLFMADGDPSVDGGPLGKKIAECYEAMNDLHSAKYWDGRAVEEIQEFVQIALSH